jgi:hypothetical protein
MSGPAAGGFTLQDTSIDEASALVVLPGGPGADQLWATTNDSGDTGRVFVVDGSGRTVGVTRWEESPRDVEALAPADAGKDVWVGDIGDNSSSREHVQVAKVPVGRGDRDVPATVYTLVYPDGAHDAETLLCDPATGRLYVATKGWIGGTLYAAPAHLDAGHDNVMKPVAAVMPMATDGTFLPGGHEVLIRGYFSATTYSWPSMDKIASFPLPAQKQGEGVGVAPDGTVWLSSEGVHSPVITFELPAKAVPAAAVSASASPKVTARPAESDGSTAVESGSGWWPWALGGVAGIAIIGALLRSLHRR